MMGPSVGFDPMFDLAVAFIGIMFVLVMCIIFFGIIQSLNEWNHNNHSPILSVKARVIGKRKMTEAHHHGADGQFYLLLHCF